MNKQKLRELRDQEVAHMPTLRKMCDALLEDEPEEQSNVDPTWIWFRTRDDEAWRKGLRTINDFCIDERGFPHNASECEIRPVNAPPETEPQKERQWPPRGMPILVRAGNNWLLRMSAGDGCYYDGGSFRSEYTILLHDEQWDYLPAPKPWPDGQLYWIGTSYGEYAFSTFRHAVGDRLPNGAYVIHVQRREDT